MTDIVFSSAYADAYDSVYATKDYSRECDILESVFTRDAGSTVSSVLDLGCGTGSHSSELARRGYRVVGVDRSPSMLALARKRALEAGLEIPFVESDLRELALEESFDAVLMMFAVLSYQCTNADVLAALQTARRHLKPGGLLVGDVWYGPAVLNEKPTDRIKTVTAGDKKIIRMASGSLDVRQHLCHVAYEIISIREATITGEAHETHTVRFFFPMELEFFCAQSGFELLALDAFPEIEKPADETTWNALFVAR